MHPPHWQLAPQTWVPSVPQARDALGAQTPSPPQGCQSDHVPFRQSLRCVPQFPQARLPPPPHASVARAGGGGISRGSVADDQLPQFGRLEAFAKQAVVMTMLGRCPLARGRHTPSGSRTRMPSTVHPSSPASSTTQQPLSLQTPPPPGPDCSATLSRDGSAFSGSRNEQVTSSTVIASLAAKQARTSKHCAPPAPPSSAGPASLVDDGEYTGTWPAGSTDVPQVPCLHVCCSPHVDLPSLVAVPSHR